MSELRVALVGEGPTDGIVIKAALEIILEGNEFVLTQLQPEESRPFNAVGTGWGGVYRWCSQAVARAGGPIRHDPLFETYDVLILHLDADVADKNYSDAGIVDSHQDLPCARPCPPASATTNALRRVILRWIAEPAIPPKTVFCTPSKSTEAWVLTALYPNDLIVAGGNVECYPSPDSRLQGKPKAGRVVSGGKKIREAYRKRAEEISSAWPAVAAVCSEARRFTDDVRATIQVQQA